EEAREGARLAEDGCFLPAQVGGLFPQGLGNPADTGRVDRRHLHGFVAIQTPGTVAAGGGERLAEVGAQEPGLAAIKGGQSEHLIEPLDLAAFAVQGPLMEITGDGGDVLWPAQPAVGVAKTGAAHLQQLLLAEVVEGPHQAVARLSERAGGFIQIDVEPGLGLARLPEDLPEKLFSLSGEAAEDPLGAFERLELVLGIAWRARDEIAVELQIGEQRAHDDRPDVAAGG